MINVTQGNDDDGTVAQAICRAVTDGQRGLRPGADAPTRRRCVPSRLSATEIETACGIRRSVSRAGRALVDREERLRQAPRLVSIALALAATIGVAGCWSQRTSVCLDVSLRAVEVANGLTNPLYLTAPVGDARLFVVEQAGRVRIIRNGTVVTQPFLDIALPVSSGGERGLLSIAFHPQYATNGYVYASFTDLAGDTRIERYTVSPTTADVVDPSSASLVLAVTQPFANRNGGLVLFGPRDVLCRSCDGGSGGDPQNNGQSTSTLLGKLLRLDVTSATPYAIPPAIPFIGQTGARAEIWALGRRNPWRFASTVSAACCTSLTWAEQPGRGARRACQSPRCELWMAGARGQRLLQASTCNAQDSSARCSSIRMTRLFHRGRRGVSGSSDPGIVGHYFYSDYCTGFLRSFRYENGQAVDQRNWGVGSLGSVLSFGEDAAGELYILSANGRVYRLEPQ